MVALEQAMQDEVHEDQNINDILLGHGLNDDSRKKLTSSFSQIEMNLMSMMDSFMPKPVEKLYTLDIYQSSVYRVIQPDDIDFVHAIKMYRLKLVNMSVYEYFMHILSKRSMDLILRSGPNRIYLSISRSLEILKDWIRFQFGNNGGNLFVKDLWAWLNRLAQKQNGFLIKGVPNAGKSWIIHALIDLFLFVGSMRPVPGYGFNFDEVFNQQIILCEEFQYKKDDIEITETLEELLSGNGAKVKVKFTSPKYVNATPFMFLSNHEPFDFTPHPNNPWPS